MITGAATEVLPDLGAGVLFRAGPGGGGRDGPDPVRRGWVSSIARKGPWTACGRWRGTPGTAARAPA